MKKKKALISLFIVILAIAIIVGIIMLIINKSQETQTYQVKDWYFSRVSIKTIDNKRSVVMTVKNKSKQTLGKQYFILQVLDDNSIVIGLQKFTVEELKPNEKREITFATESLMDEKVQSINKYNIVETQYPPTTNNLK